MSFEIDYYNKIYILAVLLFSILQHVNCLTKSLQQGLLDRVRHNDRAGVAARSALPFLIGDSTIPIGIVLSQAAKEFSKFPSIFSVTESDIRLLDQEHWGNVDKDLVRQRSKAVNEALQKLRETDSIPALRGWRDEILAVRDTFHSPPVLFMERSAAVLFGVPVYGVFVNGYTCENEQSSKPSHVWVGKRAKDKATWPGRLDSLAAGGLSAGMLPKQAILKECAEEAGIEKSDLQEKIRAVSAVSYTGFNDDMWGLKRDVLYCFDLELPPNFLPVPVDGEVESFEKIPIDSLLSMLAEPVNEDDSDNKWKPNVGVVLIDFLVRHGVLDADDPCFLELVDALRGGSCA